MSKNAFLVCTCGFWLRGLEKSQSKKLKNNLFYLDVPKETLMPCFRVMAKNVSSAVQSHRWSRYILSAFSSLHLRFCQSNKVQYIFKTQLNCQTSTTVSSCPVRVTMILVLQLYQWTFLFKLICFSATAYLVVKLCIYETIEKTLGITTCFSLERRYRPCTVKGSGVASQQRQRKSLIYA